MKPGPDPSPQKSVPTHLKLKFSKVSVSFRESQLPSETKIVECHPALFPHLSSSPHFLDGEFLESVTPSS
jgi:hypothetical protein